MKNKSGLLGFALWLCLLPQAGAGSLTSGLVLHYTFDRDEGASVTDDSGNGRTAQVNGATWVADGARGGAYRFDNNGQNLRATDEGLPAGDAPRSVALWLRMDKQSASGCTGMVGYGTDNFSGQFTGIGFDWRGGRDKVFFSPGGSCFLTDRKLPAPGTWMHVAYTYGGNGAHHLYFDGARSDGMSELRGGLNTVLSGRLLLGGHPGSEGPDGGYLDDVRIYDRELSPQEVAELAAAHPAPEAPAVTEPAAAAEEAPAAGTGAGGKPLPGGFPLGFLVGACFAGVVAFLIARQPSKNDAGTK